MVTQALQFCFVGTGWFSLVIQNTVRLACSLYTLIVPNSLANICLHVGMRSPVHSSSRTPQRTCNCCRAKPSCPLGGECLTQNVFYQATVKTVKGKETYFDTTADQFKTRFRNHTASFKNASKRNATELSKYIWSLKDSNTEFILSWKINNGSCWPLFKQNKKM